MIQESDITRFPVDLQRRIRAELNLRLKDGYPEHWLVLSDDGEIIYDSVGHATALAAMMGKRLDPEQQ